MFDKRAALHPYTIRLDHRPIRTAFLVPDDVAGPDLDAAMLFSCMSMAGRSNIFIRTDGTTIDDEEWKLLAVLDPDVVVSFINLSEGLSDEIDARASPLRLLQPKNEYDRERPSRLLSDPQARPTPLIPSVDVLGATRHAYWNLVLVDPFVREDAPVDIREFVTQNWGMWSGSDGVESARATFNRRLVSVGDEDSFREALDSLSGWEGFVYPMQFAAAYARIRGYRKPPYHEELLVVVGDTLADRIASWNTLGTQDTYRRGGMPVVWIPKSICERASLVDVLGRWLQKTADPGGQTNKAARFWSTSVPQRELESIAERLLANRYVRRVVRTDWRPVLPEVRDKRVLDLREEHDVLRANVSDEHIVIEGPQHLATTQGPWMADLYVEYNPEMYPNYVNRTFWWQFPNRRDLLHAMIGSHARVNADRFPSVRVEQGTRVTLKVLPDPTFFHYLLLGDSSSKEAAEWTRKSGLSGIAPSDTGRYLQGVIEAFGGLSNASSVLETRYWRTTFERLGGRRLESEEIRKRDLKNRVRKVLKRLNQNKDQDRAAEAIAVTALRLARQEALVRRERRFRDFVKDAKAELDAFNVENQPNAPWEFDEQDVKEAVYRLMAWGILSAGLRRTCPACGSTNWYPAVEIDDEFTCRGCGTVDPLGPEEPWHYRLNTLVDAAFNVHGLTPVVLALGQLLSESRHSFIYQPPTVLLEVDGEKESRYRELDLVCVQDGRLIIGEVKESIDLFSSADFNDMMGAAKRTLPDRLVFSAMAPEPGPFVSREIKRIAGELQPLGIAVEWYQLNHWIFEPSPVR